MEVFISSLPRHSLIVALQILARPGKPQGRGRPKADKFDYHIAKMGFTAKTMIVRVSPREEMTLYDVYGHLGVKLMWVAILSRLSMPFSLFFLSLSILFLSLFFLL